MDFEAEGLLEGLEGEKREARLRLLEKLSEAGVPDDELRKAVEEQRLALLPVEVALGGDRNLTLKEVASRADLPPELVRQHVRALGLPVPDDDEPAFDDDDVEMLESLKRFLDTR